jgi:hypothetical protein
MSPKTRTPESYVLKAVLDYLAAEHVLALRMNTLAMPTADGKRFIKAGVKGMADVLAFPQFEVNGMLRVVSVPWPTWIEVKAEGGKQSEYQKSFQAMVEREGHCYIVVHSIEELKVALKGIL